MRHTFLAVAASTLLATVSGCACNNCCNPCNAGQHKPAAEHAAAAQQQVGPGGAVSYPYYTTRGPRDFLETHPQSIGP
jgi:hypothetical protein